MHKIYYSCFQSFSRFWPQFDFSFQDFLQWLKWQSKFITICHFSKQNQFKNAHSCLIFFAIFIFLLPHRHHDIFNFMNSDSLLPPVCFDVSKALIDAIFVRAQTFLTSSLQIWRQPHRIFFQIGDKVSLAFCAPPSNETSRCTPTNVSLHFWICPCEKIFFHVRENVIWQEVYTKKVSKKTPWYANELHIQMV